jgi:alanine racemase
MARDAGLSDAVLIVDLEALAANWRTLREKARPAECAAVVKADAYGLGMARVARALAQAGCSSFFVATFEEGLALRQTLDKARVFLLHGAPPGAESDCARHRLVPILSSPEQIAKARAWARASGARLAVGLQVDTGMNRLGLSPDKAQAMADRPDELSRLELVHVMSHLASAEIEASPQNRAQLDSFRRVRERFPNASASLANSAGIFLGSDYHFDMVRPGIALYGASPVSTESHAIREVAQLFGKILQVRRVDRGMSVGYGAAHFVTGPGRIATVAIGYADGFLRALSNRGIGFIGEFRANIVGRVSMDLITLDVTAVPEALARPGAMVQLVGGPLALAEVARAAGTIEYEILSRLGPRVRRVYRGGT